MATKLVKRLGERRTYDMDFSLEPEMGEGEVITSVDPVVCIPPGLQIGPAVYSDKRAQVTISGGVVNQVYHVIYTVTTSEGSILVGDGQLKVIAD